MITQNSIYASIAPKFQFTPKPKTKEEEIKDIIQNPNDPLAKYPLRAFGYSNEVGAAVSAMPVWGKTAEAALWVPALMYLGADIYDKYKRGKEGNYSKASASAAVEQAVFQALASVILPTAAVKMGQNIAGYLTKFDGSSLSATAKEELYTKLSKDFDKGKFTRGDFTDERGNLVKGLDRTINKVLNDDYKNQLESTRIYLDQENFASKLVRFFGHTKKPVASAKADESTVENFLRNKVKEIFELQNILENSSDKEIKNNIGDKIYKIYEKSQKGIKDKALHLIEKNPDVILKKILNSNNPKYDKYKQFIQQTAATRAEIKTLLSSQKDSSSLLKKLMETPEDKKLLYSFAEKIEITRNTLGKYIDLKSRNLGFLKTAGGFVALGCLAVPIDHFVHKYIIKKFVEPGLTNVQKLHQKLSFKQNAN